MTHDDIRAAIAANRDALLALATADDPVTEFEVRCAIYADDGSLRI